MHKYLVSHSHKSKTKTQKQDGSKLTGTTKYRPRGWVVRIPAAFVGYGAVTDRGFQTVVVAETPDHALDVASDSHVWEHLDFPVSDFQVCPQNPL